MLPVRGRLLCRVVGPVLAGDFRVVRQSEVARDGGRFACIRRKRLNYTLAQWDRLALGQQGVQSGYSSFAYSALASFRHLSKFVK